MLNMDLNCKGITWVGNIYQKIEAMCLEVEDIVCQDTVKYVESQVQTVGENVKKFYAEVVQDLLPPVSANPSKKADSDLSVEQNADVVICKQSKIAVEKDAPKEKPPVHKEPKLIASARKDSSRVARNVNRLRIPSSVKPVKEEGLGLSLEQDIFAIHKLSKAGNGEDPKRENQAGTKASSLSLCVHKEPKLVASARKDSSPVAHNVKHLLPPSSVKPDKGVGLDSSLEQGSVAIQKVLKPGTGEDSTRKKQAGTKASSFSTKDPLDEKPPLAEASEVIAPKGEDSGGTSMFSIHKQNHEKVCDELTKSARPTLVEVIGFDTIPKAGSTHNSDLSETVADISGTPPSSDLVFRVVPCENKGVEIGQDLATNILSAESNGFSTSRSNEKVSLMGSLKDEVEQGNRCAELGAFTTPSEIANTGRSDDDHEELDSSNDAVEPGIEIIEEYDNAKLGESCIVVDSQEFRFICQKAGKNRSYKKKIRDAFASRKGLAKKDYEQLAIWCEDLDARNNQERAESSALSTLPTHDSCEESEWELL